MRVAVESAFGRLKGMWNILRFISAHQVLAVAVQEVKVALHDVSEARESDLEAEWEEEQSVADTTATEEGVETGDARHTAGAARRVQLVKALGLPWVDGEESSGASV